MSFSKSFLQWLNTLSPVRMILFFYFIAAIFSTLLLCLPFAYQGGVEVPFIDIVFTAISALSVTGLSTITIADTLSTSGIFLLAFIMQLGAVGVMAIGTFIWLILGKKIGFKERQLIMTDQNQTSFEGMVRLIKQIVLVLFTVELFAFLILGTYFLKYFSQPSEAYLHGFFGTISAVTNAGFDITGSSLIPYKDDYFVQFIYMLLIIFGAIGFPVLIEVKNYLFKRNDKRATTHFSLFTKLTSFTFLVLIVVGTLVFYLLDMNHFLAGKTWHESLFYSLFQSITTRSGGLSTMDVSQLTESNQLWLSFLMFIGASPSSAGGGIRTTTFALVVIFIVTYARGGSSIRIFRREVHEDDLLKAVTVTLMALIFVFASVLFITTIEPFSITKILFEVTSAFGTVGLSLGITGDLTTVSKVILMFLMFVGRVGIITFLFMFKKTKKTGSYHYPKERISIG
ncbi:TrkH family potassium uptake protein [Ornithinibacillus bavariensis]|uniref:Ktr system potassium uptake protein D n=1 Tax=Ornithinibacillus bavariensis TaxID=545502 RepID=A0A919X4Z1_9BACI|nr:TrkH family potassium uptake protein [Ornithinibacillus bavariensis]GIO25986.1 ktr system potassium uptake protein D [Ornithinibacillus bavariensis]